MPTIHPLSESDIAPLRADKSLARTMAETQRKMTEAVDALTPEGFIALAHAVAGVPCDMPVAIGKLTELVDDWTQALATAQDAMDAAVRAVRSAKAPSVAEATRRTFELIACIDRIEREIVIGESSIEARRLKLRSAGMTLSELAAFCPPFDPAPLRLELVSLNDELAKLEAFLATRDLSKLPAGFEIRESLRPAA